MAKKELSMSEFRDIIREEALKLKKRIVLENEKKALENELKSLMNESFAEGTYEESVNEMEMEEGWFGPDKSEIEANRQALSAQIDALLAKVPERMEVLNSKEAILQKAADANFKGKPWLRKSRTGKLVLGFEPELTKLQKIGSAMGGALKGGHTFGSGGPNQE
jgi:hypothetical protein